MPDLSFQVEGAEVVANAATPLLAFKLRLTDANPEQAIHTVALRARFSWKLPAANTHPKIRSACSTSLASPADGARLCAISCGPTVIWWCFISRDQPWLISRCHVRSKQRCLPTKKG